MGDRLVEGVLGHADRAGAQVELADVDRIQCRGKGFHARVQNVFLPHRIILEPERADVDLHVHDIVDQVIVIVPAVGGEPDVGVLTLDVTAPAEHRHHAGDVAVADVVLLPRRPVQNAVGAVLLARRRQNHVGVVDVGAARALGQSERHHFPGVQVVGGLQLGVLVLALPDGSQPEDGDLLGVPVRQPVEPEDLREGGVARGIPALVRIARGELRGREERREQLLALDEVDEIGGPLRGQIVVEDALLALAFEPVDGRAQQPARFIVELRRVVGVRVEEQAVGLDRVMAPA